MTSDNQNSRKVYEGSKRKLVLAFDVGTTFSGISYSILEPGQEPTIRGVTRFPAQDSTHGASKIPTIMYYDDKGNVCAAGAEATRDGIEVEAEDNGWVKAEWFKLHLRSKHSESTPTAGIPPLPSGMRAIDVLADFLKYLYNCAAQYIRETHLNGSIIWTSVEDDISYVLSHPNGWTAREQGHMRKAAHLAGLIPHKAHPRLSFVTEGEASLHFCLQAGILTDPAAKSDNASGFVIVDAGGGTIDISAYSRSTDTEAMVFKEIAPALCVFQGSVYVNVYAKMVLLGLLEGSKFSEDIDHVVNVFEKSSKLRFKNDKDPQYIKFGGARDNDTSRNIRFGQLKLEGSDVAALFQPAIDAIVEGVLHQQEIATHKISHVLLVGGFAANTWLFNSVSGILTEKDTSMNVIRPEEHINKAVADGSMSFFLDHFVKTRVSKMAYGTSARHEYNPTDPEHVLRSEKVRYCKVTERNYLHGIFFAILLKDTQVPEAQVYRESFYTQSFSEQELKKKIACRILGYAGLNAKPTRTQWMDLDPDNYVQLCTIEAELTSLPISIRTKHNSSGRQFYEIDFEVLLFFGLTELNAQILWKNSEGIEMRGPARVVYNAKL